jgi:hypothetical protein
MADYSSPFSATLSGSSSVASGLQETLDGGMTIHLTTLPSVSTDFISGTADWQGSVTEKEIFGGIPLSQTIDFATTSLVSGTAVNIQTTADFQPSTGLAEQVDIIFDVGQLSSDETEIGGHLTITVSATSATFTSTTFALFLVVPSASSGEIVNGGQIIEAVSGSIQNVSVLSEASWSSNPAAKSITPW